jgi:hypothetical protein
MVSVLPAFGLADAEALALSLGAADAAWLDAGAEDAEAAGAAVQLNSDETTKANTTAKTINFFIFFLLINLLV